MEHSDPQKEMLKAVIFRLSGHEHAVDVRQVKEILINKPVSPVVEAPDFVDGVIRLRGRIVPIIDLARRLKLPMTPRTVETCMIVVKLGNKLAGFIVDSASELLNIPVSKIEVPTDIVGGIHTRFIEGVAYLGDRFLVILDLDSVLKVSEKELAELSEIYMESESLPESEEEGIYAG